MRPINSKWNTHLVPTDRRRKRRPQFTFCGKVKPDVQNESTQEVIRNEENNTSFGERGYVLCSVSSSCSSNIRNIKTDVQKI